ncbi:diacylglycerol kinase family protein [Ligilactobacillus salitolerans]|uniref:Diacylglycerol kinase family protein n=1 Tax=Ligilactobacillus salitolerans TaxID=1808352 RepID=A0A401IQW5_9LACO|nr:YegS/Rv2252/BmrU family lipid kinase [Ligilactobacillus salitolerans]GBG93928.1 diacylglycerol kinase family protein [Ligilactobacillus salitolerans]
MRSFFLIVNCRANHGKSEKIWHQVKNALDEKKVDYTFKLTKKPGDARKFAYAFTTSLSAAAAQKYVVLVVGGDGTLNDALNGIKDARSYELPLSFIPSGNSNSFARGIGLAKEPLAALDQTLNAQEPFFYDIGSYQELTHNTQGYFLNDYSMGQDAYLISMLHHQKPAKLISKLHLGLLSYVIALFKAYLDQEAFPVTLRIGDKYEFFQHSYIVNVSNQPYLSGGFVLSPDADATDHQLDLILADNMNFFKFFLLGLMVYFRKQFRLPGIHRYKNTKLHIVVNSVEFGQIDGEELPNQYYDLYFKSVKYPFWLDVESIPVKERRQ